MSPETQTQHFPTRPATAAVFHGPGPDVRFEQITVDAPRPTEILVRMVAAGICHTDLSMSAGALPFPLPGVLGHEGAGVVEEVGEAVTDLVPGDAVLLSFTSCGICHWCRAGRPALCAHWLTLNLINGRRADGSAPLHTLDGLDLGGSFFGQSAFATLAVVDRRSAVKVPRDSPLPILAPLGCGVQTGAGTVFSVLRPWPGASVAILGVGTVGMSALLACRLTPATQIIAVDRVAERLTLASDLGATDTVEVGGPEHPGLESALADLTGGRGVDLVVDTTADPTTAGAALRSLATGGTLALVGAPPPGTHLAVDMAAALHGRRVVGVTEGDCDPAVSIPVLADLVAQGRFPIDRLVRHYPFVELPRAVADMTAGRTVKPVLLFD